jgi:hypothetical protein
LLAPSLKLFIQFQRGDYDERAAEATAALITYIPRHWQVEAMAFPIAARLKGTCNRTVLIELLEVHLRTSKESQMFIHYRGCLFALALLGTSLVALAQVSEGAKMAFNKAQEEMMHGMMSELTGDPDKDFAMLMVPHHQGAIEMAKVELQYGKDPQLRVIAEKIIAAQEAEIAELKKWQQEHGM